MPDPAYPSLAEQTTPVNQTGTVQLFKDESGAVWGFTPANAAAQADSACTYLYLRTFFR